MIAHLESALAGVWRLSWQASTLIALVLLVQWLVGGRWPARWRYNLWLIVLVRLVLPWSWPSQLSVYNAVHWGTEKAATIAAPVVAKAAPAVPAPAVVPPVFNEPSQIENTVAENLPPPVGEPSPPRVESPTTLPSFTAAPTPARAAWSWRKVAAAVWALGALGLAAQVGFTTWRMLRRVRESTPLTDPALLGLLEECRGLMGVAAPLPLHESSAVTSPALMGFLRPRLLLPRGLAESFSAPELRHIFLHELAHVRRRDLPLNWLITGLQVLHWFNPVIWLGLARLRADRELACDALAIERNGGEPARDYGRTIVKLLERAAMPATAPGMIGILESRHQMVRRIRMIAQFRGGQRWPLLAMALTAVLALVGLTDAARTVRAAVEKITAPEKLLRVTVVDAETGQPIPDAAVYYPFGHGMIASERPPAPPQTDRTGVALVPGDADYGVLVRHPEYAPAAWGRNQWKRELNGPLPKEITVRLVRGEMLGGIVRDEAGQPAPGVLVELNGWGGQAAADGPDYLQSPEHPSPYCPMVTTDAEGRWQSEHFPVDVAMVQLRLHRSDGSMASFSTKAGPGYSAEGRGVGAITLDDLRARRLVSVLPAGTEVRGRALDAAGKPLAGVTVKDWDRRWHRPAWSTKTDAEGRFTLPHRDSHQVLLTLSRDGLANSYRVVNIEPGVPEQIFRLTSARTLKVRVVDEAGQPVVGALVMPPELDLGWKATTDAEGRATWPAAPAEGAVLAVSTEQHRSRVLRLVPAEQETTVVLRTTGEEGLPAVIRPLGADGKPLAHFSVLAAYIGSSHSEFGNFEPLGEGRDGVCTVIVPTEKTKGDPFRLKIEAPGHAPFLSDPIYGADGEPLLTPTLAVAVPAPTSALAGQVLLPDGTPAAKASVILTRTDGEHSSINLQFFGGEDGLRIMTRNATAVHADGDGKFTLPAAAPETPVLIYHKKGSLATTVAQLAASPARLLPWGTVEGKLVVNGQPRGGYRIGLSPRYTPRPYDLWFGPLIETDKAGNFKFYPAPVGECVIAATQSVPGQRARSWETRVTVQSGGITHADCVGEGPSVTGRVQLSKLDGGFDWQKDFESALLTTHHDAPTPPSYEDFVRHRDYLAWFRRPRPSTQETHSTYGLVFEPDGSFRAEGVPPGRYELELRPVRRNSTKPNDTTEIGFFREEVVVPPADAKASVNLGNFTLQLTGEPRPQTPPLELAVQTLDGRTTSLADHAGKQVLLLFWATWAPPSAEKLAEWKRLYETHGTNPRFVMLGISLDRDPAKAQQFADAHEWHWLQARLEGGQKATVTERLEVDALPATLLVGPDGRLSLRNADEALLRTAVEAFLTPPR